VFCNYLYPNKCLGKRPNLINMAYRLIIFSLSAIILFLPFWTSAAPSVSGVIGDIIHGEEITVSGSDFGIKSNPMPTIWDDCSGTNVLDKWSGAWPVASDQPISTPRYTTPINGVVTAHNNATKYLAGRAYDSGSGEGFPFDVMVWKNRPLTAFPFYSYVSWYQRVDPSSDFGDNFKWFDYSTRNSPYTMNSSDDSNWYLEYVGGVGNSFHINDDGGSIWNIGPDWTVDYLGNGKYFGGSIDPTNQWVKIELVIKYTDQNDGWFDIYEKSVHKKNGAFPHSYNGPTDKYSTAFGRNESIGGYSRNMGANNWRYFNDIYLDYAISRLMICAGSSWSNRGTCEIQIPSAWSDNTITASVNQATFANGASAFLYVIDAGDTANTIGFPITIGEDSIDSIAPVSPSGLSIM
jgi:hypothetical protein